jgi:transposase
MFFTHGADGRGRAVFSRKLGRSKLLAFCDRQPRCLVGLEACAGSHYWGRELLALAMRFD